MKKTFLVIALIFFATSLFGQYIPNSVVKKHNLNGNSTFYEIQRAMNEYWESLNVRNGFITENNTETKAAGWKLYKRWEFYWENRINRVTGEFPKTNSVAEFEKYINSANYNPGGTDFNENWVNLGTNTSAGGYAGLGRINCIAFHPTDNNTFWVGSPAGGIWKTVNGGVNWTILNNNQSVLGVSDIAIPNDYATSNTIYIATGDRDGGSLWSLGGGQGADNISIGVLKSTDGGITWNNTGLIYPKDAGKKIYRLMIHPADNTMLFASTSDGIFKSINSGANWTAKSGGNEYRDMQFKPGDPSVIYCGAVPGNPTLVYKSANTGETWTGVTVPVATHFESQIRLAVSANNPSVVYVACQDGKIYKSVNSGNSYSQVNTNNSQNMLGYYTNGSGNASQASYDLTIACSPVDANTVFLGSICTWKSVDGGVTWNPNTSWTTSPVYNPIGVPVVHADKHILAYQNNTTLFEGNDGGIYKTINGGTSWTDLSNGLNISQLYRIGVSQTNSAIVLTGLQDNGSKLLNGGNWTDVKGGDGMECIVDYTNSNFMYATYVKGQISRSSDNGVSFNDDISANIPGGQPEGAWVTPYSISPANNSTLIAGYDKVWKTTDRGETWTTASQVLSAGTKLRSLAIAPSNSSIIYTADQDNMWKTVNAGATDWTQVTLPASTNSITYIAVKNTDPNTLWITYGGYTDGSKVFQSTDGGTSWTNISAGLPNLPVMCIVYNKNGTGRNVLFAGTDVGVYVKDGTNNWVSYSSGLPNVVVSELEIFYNASGDKLRAGTFGRGLWQTDIEAALLVGELTAGVPDKFGISENYPNPFNPKTRINYQIPVSSGVTIKVFNQLGQEVASLVDDVKKAGYYTVEFDASNLASGVYFYGITAGDFKQVKKMIVLK